jgi:hypothetical protein
MVVILGGVVAGGLWLGGGAGAGAAPTAARTRLGAGLSIVVPRGWHVARRLTALVEPYERFTLASFPLRRPAPDQVDCGPDQAVSTIPADGALAFVIEYGRGGASRQGFPAEPRRFVLPGGPARRYECFGLGWLLRFRVGVRTFQVMIAVGRRAGGNRQHLLGALSSLRVVAATAAG